MIFLYSCCRVPWFSLAILIIMIPRQRIDTIFRCFNRNGFCCGTGVSMRTKLKWHAHVAFNVTKMYEIGIYDDSSLWEVPCKHAMWIFMDVGQPVIIFTSLYGSLNVMLAQKLRRIKACNQRLVSCFLAGGEVPFYLLMQAKILMIQYSVRVKLEYNYSFFS